MEEEKKPEKRRYKRRKLEPPKKRSLFQGARSTSSSEKDVNPEENAIDYQSQRVEELWNLTKEVKLEELGPDDEQAMSLRLQAAENRKIESERRRDRSRDRELGGIKKAPQRLRGKTLTGEEIARKRKKLFTRKGNSTPILRGIYMVKDGGLHTIVSAGYRTIQGLAKRRSWLWFLVIVPVFLILFLVLFVLFLMIAAIINGEERTVYNERDGWRARQAVWANLEGPDSKRFGSRRFCQEGDRNLGKRGCVPATRTHGIFSKEHDNDIPVNRNNYGVTAMVDAKRLGEVIRKRRESKVKKSLRKIAEEARVSPGYLSVIETGKVSKPSDEVLESIAGKLGWTFDAMMREAKKA